MTGDKGRTGLPNLTSTQVKEEVHSSFKLSRRKASEDTRNTSRRKKRKRMSRSEEKGIETGKEPTSDAEALIPLRASHTPTGKEQEKNLSVKGKIAAPGAETLTRKLDFLVDTGAERSFISIELFDKCLKNLEKLGN